MKIFLIFISMSCLCLYTKAQSYADFFSCDQSTAAVTSTFSPNSTISYTGPGDLSDCLYLCGPSTIVYDTSSASQSRVLVNANCTYTFKQRGPITAIKFIYLKGNAILNILSSPFYQGCLIYKEATATINDFSSVTSTVTVCSPLLFPTVSCALGIESLTAPGQKIKIYPNPASKEAFIESEDYIGGLDLRIKDVFGQELKNEKWLSPKQPIDLSQLNPGVYYLEISDHEKTLSVKKIVKQ